jgi:hypothetical protein
VNHQPRNLEDVICLLWDVCILCCEPKPMASRYYVMSRDVVDCYAQGCPQAQGHPCLCKSRGTL